MPYPSPRIFRSVHEAPATLFFLFWAEIHALLCPPTRCSHIFSPCWHSKINPKEGNSRRWRCHRKSVPKAKISNKLLSNAHPRAHLADSGDRWTFGLGGPGSEIRGVPFTCQVPSLVETLLSLVWSQTSHVTLMYMCKQPKTWYRILKTFSLLNIAG